MAKHFSKPHKNKKVVTKKQSNEPLISETNEIYKKPQIERLSGYGSAFFAHDKTPHKLNWYVHRSSAIRRTLSKMWHEGSGIEDKKTMEGADISQKAVGKANQIFRKIETNGMNGLDDLISDAKNSGQYNESVKIDGFNTKKVKCMSPGFYHIHLTDSRSTCCYVMLLEFFPKQKIANIISIGPHENFDFTPSHNTAEAFQKALMAAKKLGYYDEHFNGIPNKEHSHLAKMLA